MRRRWHLTSCLGLLFGLTLIAQAATTSSIRGRVSRVVDGDTIVVDTVGTVRLIGIDSPETKDPRRPVDAFGAEASNQMSALALNQDVRLEFEGQRRDVYGRTLAYVYLADDRMLNVEMIRRGFAHAYTTYPFSKMEEFRSWQRDAQRDSRGLWSTPSRASTTEQGPVQPGQSVAAPLPEPAEVLVDTGPRTTALYHRDTCAWVRGTTTTVRLTSSDAKSRYFQRTAPACTAAMNNRLARPPRRRFRGPASRLHEAPWRSPPPPYSAPCLLRPRQRCRAAVAKRPRRRAPNASGPLNRVAVTAGSTEMDALQREIGEIAE
ncbi:MAG TPA: thermonuclease family protein [Gemmatimonadaceae bacterium]|nr:thermonuclease family protein [Gemmatimonadaceae bacterium]